MQILSRDWIIDLARCFGDRGEDRDFLTRLLIGEHVDIFGEDWRCLANTTRDPLIKPPYEDEIVLVGRAVEGRIYTIGYLVGKRNGKGILTFSEVLKSDRRYAVYSRVLNSDSEQVKP
jgi:hypothetical protein